MPQAQEVEEGEEPRLGEVHASQVHDGEEAEQPHQEEEHRLQLGGDPVDRRLLEPEVAKYEVGEGEGGDDRVIRESERFPAGARPGAVLLREVEGQAGGAHLHQVEEEHRR
jgi:hypothetical protein